MAHVEEYPETGIAEAAFLPSEPSVPTVRRTVGVRYLKQVLLTALPLLLADVVAVLLALVFSSVVLSWTRVLPINHYVELYLALASSLVVAYLFCGLYPGVAIQPVREFRQIVLCCSLVCSIVLATVLIYHRPESPYVPLMQMTWALLLPIAVIARPVARYVSKASGRWGQPAVILGAGEGLDQLYRQVNVHPRYGIQMLGNFAPQAPRESESRESESRECPYLGSYEDVAEFAESHGVYWLFVQHALLQDCSLKEFLARHQLTFPHVFVVQGGEVLTALWSQSLDMNGSAAVHVRNGLLLPGNWYLKRVLDLMVSVVISVALAPLILLLALLVRISSPGPVFYGQRRVGLDGTPFTAWKFRTMVVDADRVLAEYLAQDKAMQREWEQNCKLQHDPRVTWIGRFLRKSSLDELPQLWNVLRSEMSLVGPRPLPKYHLANCDVPFVLTRQRVLPGITGLWQIEQRGNGDVRALAICDGYYIRNWSIWLDLYILARTVTAVLLPRGAY